ncbi:hypothetical protein Poli38472_000130 [Pythium oligandrum]|uniref:Rrn7/TAF1B N-terminal cyclin domain-containing protein n=1 Tax=Pythium oligandrum TaxID=41045 RepID=A0A8K1FIT8_PYTOL|nr:hypothetical protein Poli38472_000130 [Pythium oligandrum]|eukprot:TMW60088.1 hypothetical protein Poli38472_000130 [Pythium oligandrum]
MLECTTCGAKGDEYFGTNFFGELVCELCGTQSFLQTRTETQDAEDIGLDLNALSRMKKRSAHKKRQRKSKVKEEEKKKPTLLECIVATQHILHQQALALVKLGFPDDFPRVVRELWFFFLETWESKGKRPILRCFTEFYYRRQKADKKMDPVVTNEVLEQWDAERAKELGQLFEADAESDKEDHVPVEDTRRLKRIKTGRYQRVFLRDQWSPLDWFTLPDLVGLLVLAGRMLNVAALPCDYAYWIQREDVPYHNMLEVCTPAILDSIDSILNFFDTMLHMNRITTPIIAYRAHYLQYHLQLQLPPLNASLIAYNICENTGLPSQVFRNFQWIAAQSSLSDASSVERTFQTSRITRAQAENSSPLESGPGIVAYLLAAIRLCPGWHEWIYERVLDREQHIPPSSLAATERMPRRELKAFVEYCEEVVLGITRGQIPEQFESHVNDLKTQYGDKEHLFGQHYEEHPLRAYPALYEEGVCVETTAEIEKRIAQIKEDHVTQSDTQNEKEPTFFYPVYTSNQQRDFLHAPFEAAVELLCEYIDAPMSAVLTCVHTIDRDLSKVCSQLVREAAGRVPHSKPVTTTRKKRKSYAEIQRIGLEEEAEAKAQDELESMPEQYAHEDSQSLPRPEAQEDHHSLFEPEEGNESQEEQLELAQTATSDMA